MRERFNGILINTNMASQPELEAMVQYASEREQEAKNDKFKAMDALHRRFGRTATAQVIDMFAYRNGQSQLEFELNPIDDEPTPPTAA